MIVQEHCFEANTLITYSALICNLLFFIYATDS